MDSIDLKDLLGRFTQSPLDTTIAVLHMMVKNLVENSLQIGVLIAAFWLVRWTMLHIIDSMVPDPKKPKRGHYLRTFFITKVTDEDGRLTERPRWWFRNKNGGNPRLRRKTAEEKAYYSRRTERAAGIASMIKSLLNLVMFVTLAFTIMTQLGITASGSTLGWLLGGLGVALALGVQGLIRDFLGGIHVLVEDQYGLGDYIDAQLGVAGIVTHIGLRTTRLKGADGTIYHIRHSEMSKVANRTQATGNILVDTTFTWNNLPDDKKQIQVHDLDFAEKQFTQALVTLRRTLKAVDRIATLKPVEPEETPVQLKEAALAVPMLVTDLSTHTMTNLTAITEADLAPDETAEQEVKKSIINAIDRLDRGGTPLFEQIEMLGLVNSTSDSITLRAKVRVVNQTSRAQSLALLRREVFKHFAPHDISVEFEEVPEGAVI